MKSLLIWGAGDQGTVTLDCALAMKQYDKIDFLEIKEKGHRQIPGYVIYKETDDRNELLCTYDEVIVASGDNDLREMKTSILISLGVTLASLIHPTAIISPSATISKGSTILAGSIINTNASVGTGCIINTGVIVEHDCIIENYVNISPRTAMAGHTTIGRKTFVGIGSTFIDGIKVDKEALIGAGAVVTQNIPERAVAVGVPAKIMKFR